MPIAAKLERFNRIVALRIQLARTTDLKKYRSILGQIAGLSGSRLSKQRAGSKGGKAKAANRLK